MFNCLEIKNIYFRLFLNFEKYLIDCDVTGTTAPMISGVWANTKMSNIDQKTAPLVMTFYETLKRWKWNEIQNCMIAKLVTPRILTLKIFFEFIRKQCKSSLKNARIGHNMARAPNHII